MPSRPFVLLLIEDDRLDAELFVALCRYAASEPDIHVRINGQEALDYLERSHDGDAASPRPDLIVLDLNMPVMDGHTFLQEVKRRNHLRTIPILVLSNLDNKEDVQHAYQHSASDYVVKPATLNEFEEFVRSLFLRWRSPIQGPVHAKL